MESIDPQQLHRRADSVKVYDIRGKPDARRIPRSVRAEAEALEAGSDLPFSRDDDVVLYCGSGSSCSRIARTLRERGYRAVALEGGYKAWLEAGLPTEER